MATTPAARRLRARNTAERSENRIHDSSVARRYGFAGGLVPGVTVYAYLTRPVVEAWGRAWLERGTMDVAFLAPFYDGDEVVVEPSPASETGPDGPPVGAEGDDRAAELIAANGDGHVCARARAVLPAAPPTRPDVGDWPVQPLPEAADRHVATPDGLRGVEALGTLEATFRAEEAAPYLEAVADDLGAYQGPHAVAHPGWLLSLANYVLSANVSLGPWVHTASVVRHLATVSDGDEVSVRARVAGLSERRGHEIVDLEVLMVVGEGPVLQIRHSAIYRLRPSAGEDGGSGAGSA